MPEPDAQKESPKDLVTIVEAKNYLRDNLKEGATCPCCTQKVILWKKSLISSAVADLIRLVKLFYGKPVHISEFTSQRSNFYILSYWRLIVPVNVATSPDKKASGYWAPTQEGIDFVNKKTKLKKYVNTYNNKPISFEGKEIDIEEALNNKFDYRELVGMGKLDKTPTFFNG